MSDFDPPPPNLQGNYRGSCAICLRGTDTEFAFKGEAEFLSAGLVNLGVPLDQSIAMVDDFFAERYGADPGKVLDGRYEMFVKVCGECARKAGFPSPGVPAFGVPMFEQSQ